ncbi:MAG: NAD(P)H-binding protein [Thermodesulfovibrionales bacterium]|nr:NAD(P)H-binding protein [Thermodesulfovibrionales bacterium]
MFFVAGGTGFIGRHLIHEMQRLTFKVRCLVRTPEKAEICKNVGFEAFAGDITNRESLKGAMNNCDVAVHLVGIIEEKGELTFQRVHVEGTANFVDEAKNAGVKHIFYQSALGASAASQAKYYKTKAEAEEIVKSSGISYIIFRPSLVIGNGDGFTEKLIELIRLGPFVPIPGNGNAKFQPLYIEDWLRCFFTVFSDGSPGVDFESNIYEFGGTEYLTYNEMVLQLMEAMGVNKPLVHLPLGLVKMSLPFYDISKGIGSLLGKRIPSVTGEQLALLQTDNICGRDSVERLFHFKPVTYSEALSKISRHS